MKRDYEGIQTAKGATNLTRHSLFIHIDVLQELIDESNATGTPVNVIIRDAIAARRPVRVKGRPRTAAKKYLCPHGVHKSLAGKMCAECAVPEKAPQ
jgi:hypothetical protein